jgi:CheY-like chemotaxis protein
MPAKSYLVIEPDHNTRVALRTILEAEGCFVVSATGTSDIASLFGRMACPHCIFVSSALANAAQLIEFFRTDPQYHQIPIIQLGLNSDPLLPGATASINRPIDREGLLVFVGSSWIRHPNYTEHFAPRIRDLGIFHAK